MGRVVFSKDAPGYLAMPAHPGPGIVGMRGWWRLTPAFKEVAHCPPRFFAMGL